MLHVVATGVNPIPKIHRLKNHKDILGRLNRYFLKNFKERHERHYNIMKILLIYHF